MKQRHPSYSTKLGKILKDIRSQQQLRQKDVAHHSGVHVSTLCKIERGTSDPSLYALRRICFALQVELSEVFEIEEDPSYEYIPAKLVNLGEVH